MAAMLCAGPGWLPSTARIISFDSSTVFTWIARRSYISSPNWDGWMRYSLISPFTSSPTMVSAEVELVDRLPGLLRRERNAGAERFEHFGAARGRRHRAPHVLGHPGARRGGDESRAGRDVESMRRVASGAAGIDEMRIVLHLDVGRQLAHHLRRGGDLPDRFLLHAQPDDEPRDLRRRELAAHDLAHHVQHLVVEHLAVLDRALDRLGDRDLLHRCLPSRKFFSMAWPCSVSSASGWNCTPSSGRARWRSPMISPSSDSALTARQPGSDWRSTTSEW